MRDSPWRIAILTFIVVLLWQVQRELGQLSPDDDT